MDKNKFDGAKGHILLYYGIELDMIKADGFTAWLVSEDFDDGALRG